MKAYQACYGKPGNNWELLNLSPDTPSTMVSFFEKLGNSCTPQNVGAENTVGEDGSPLCLYELVSNDNIVCVLRAQYGERDSFGRPKMFAHGFMFDAENMLSDPNSVLTIADSNFRFSSVKTALPPPSLDREPAYSLSEAARELDVDASTLKRLVGAVYLLLASESDFPLYICGRSDLRTIKSAIYIILKSMPYSLRYQLAFSNANSFRYEKFKRVMFVRSAPERERYLSLETGESNLDFGEIEAHPEKFAPLRAAYSKGAEYERYCEELAKTMRELGFAYDAGFDETNIADVVMRGTDRLGEKDDTELMRYLVELLARVTAQNLFVDNYIADVLAVFDAKKLLPNDNVMKRLDIRCGSTQSTKLAEIHKKIRMRALLVKGEGAMVDFLDSQYSMSKARFDDVCGSISKIDGGDNAIATFFRNRISSCGDFEELINVGKDAKNYWGRSGVKDAARLCGIELAKKGLSVREIDRANYRATLDTLKFAFDVLFPGESNEMIKRIVEGLKRDFWTTFNFAEFRFNDKCIANCREMRIPGNRKAELAAELSGLYDTVRQYDKDPRRVSDIARSLDRIDTRILPLSEVEALASTVREFVYSSLKREENGQFGTWVKLIRFGGVVENPIPQMVEWELSIICLDEVFEEAYYRNGEIRAMAPQVLDWLERYDRKSDGAAKSDAAVKASKAIKREVKFLSGIEKEREKEQQKREREKEREESRQKSGKRQDRDDPFVKGNKDYRDSQDGNGGKNDKSDRSGMHDKPENDRYVERDIGGKHIARDKYDKPAARDERDDYSKRGRHEAEQESEAPRSKGLFGALFGKKKK